MSVFDILYKSEELWHTDTRSACFCGYGFMCMLVRCRSHRAEELQAARICVQVGGIVGSRLDFNGGAAPKPLPASAPGRFSLTRDFGAFVHFAEFAHLQYRKNDWRWIKEVRWSNCGGNEHTPNTQYGRTCDTIYCEWSKDRKRKSCIKLLVQRWTPRSG